MKRLLMSVAGVLMLAIAAGLLVQQHKFGADGEPPTTASTTPMTSAVSAGMVFTDADGVTRLPSDEERAALSAAFQADLAKLTKDRKMPAKSRKEASGAVSAVVGTSQLRFLTVNIDDSGEAEFNHSTVDESGNIEIVPANELPEM